MKFTSPDEARTPRLTTAGAAIAPASTTLLFRRVRRATPRPASGRISSDMPLYLARFGAAFAAASGSEPAWSVPGRRPDGKRRLRLASRPGGRYAGGSRAENKEGCA